MHRLYLQVYLTIVACLLAFVLAASSVWLLGPDTQGLRNSVAIVADLASSALPPETAPKTIQQSAVHELAGRVHLDLELYAEERQSIATGGDALPPLPADQAQGGWVYGRGGPAWTIQLSDGRWLVARAPRQSHREVALTFVGFLGTVALLIGLLAYPVARRLSGRLERLQASVERFGQGDLSTRVKVEGRDEVARLAESFNAAVGRIEELVGAHKMLLANASHELRTPISRIRLGIELIKDAADPIRRRALEMDIAELDELIDEILLASRLNAKQDMDVREDIDLLGLAAEVAARYDDVAVSGASVHVQGDPRLLRRLVRNLLENAHRHGAPTVEVDVRRQGGLAMLTVTDEGPGIPLSEREHVFEPFRRGSNRSMVGGSGLGLTLVRQIARRHGGDAALDAPPGKSAGTRFVVTMPASGAPPAGVLTAVPARMLPSPVPTLTAPGNPAH